MRRFRNNKPYYVIFTLSWDISEILLKCPKCYITILTNAAVGSPAMRLTRGEDTTCEFDQAVVWRSRSQDFLVNGTGHVDLSYFRLDTRASNTEEIELTPEHWTMHESNRWRLMSDRYTLSYYSQSLANRRVRLVMVACIIVLSLFLLFVSLTPPLQSLSRVLPRALHEHRLLRPSKPAQSGSQWCSLIQQIWKGILAERSKNIPAGPIKSFDELYETDKIVIDTMTSYLSRKFILDQPGAINVLESVIQTFKLNSEQEQAFRIVEFFTLLHVFLQESRGILSFLCQNS